MSTSTAVSGKDARTESIQLSPPRDIAASMKTSSASRSRSWRRRNCALSASMKGATSARSSPAAATRMRRRAVASRTRRQSGDPKHWYCAQSLPSRAVARRALITASARTAHWPGPGTAGQEARAAVDRSGRGHHRADAPTQQRRHKARRGSSPARKTTWWRLVHEDFRRAERLGALDTKGRGSSRTRPSPGRLRNSGVRCHGHRERPTARRHARQRLHRRRDLLDRGLREIPTCLAFVCRAGRSRQGLLRRSRAATAQLALELPQHRHRQRAVQHLPPPSTAAAAPTDGLQIAARHEHQQVRRVGQRAHEVFRQQQAAERLKFRARRAGTAATGLAAGRQHTVPRCSMRRPGASSV